MTDSGLREHVLYLLGGDGAHVNFEHAIVNLPVDLRGESVEGVRHTPWRLLEHMRICQWDILEFCINPEHVSPEFPDGFWPIEDAPQNNAAWEESVNGFIADLRSMMALVADPSTDLLAQLPHSNGQTILRGALMLADHNSYHIGQLIFLRKCLGAWEE
jgi:hypothetical protein